MLIIQKHLQAVTRALVGKEVAPVGELLDKVEALQAENKRLTKRLDMLVMTNSSFAEDILTTRAANKQLREALEYAHCQLLNINAIRKASNRTEVNLEILVQALHVVNGRK